MVPDTLKYSLQALVQPSDFQLRLLDVWMDPPPDELGERFVQARRHALADPEATITKAHTAAMAALYAKFHSFSGPSNAEHWRDAALSTSEHWEEVRWLARDCLQAFDWSVEQPPLDIQSYGEDFYEPPKI